MSIPASIDDTNNAPANSLVNAMLTDLYQLTMCYAYWDAGKHNSPAVFELFFRKNPFGGQFTVFAGLDECLKYVQNFKFTDDDIEYLRNSPAFVNAKPDFFDNYLRNISCANLKMFAMQEGTIVFPREPLIRVEGPLGITQLLETALLTLVNFPSLVATNATRMKLAAGPDKKLAEFGLRRAQGPDGGFSASKYCFLGGFDATSNVLAGKLLGIPIIGTHAHAFIQSFNKLQKVETMKVNGTDLILFDKVMNYRNNILVGYRKYGWAETNEGELAAFISYACSFPSSFLCLIDTYDTLKSGLLNFVLVALALNECGFQARGIRLDSGDLSLMSIQCWKCFRELSHDLNLPFLSRLDIVASNDINEEVLLNLDKSHKINIFGIGTHLVTCQKQPALGCVYKLVDLDGIPRIKLSEDINKVLIPGPKRIYRIFIGDVPTLDFMTLLGEPSPVVGEDLSCRNPFRPEHRVNLIPTKVSQLSSLVFNREQLFPRKSAIIDARSHLLDQLRSFSCSGTTEYAFEERKYPTMVSEKLYHFFKTVLSNAKVI